MDLKTLERMTVIKLREEAMKLPDVSGVRGMNKDELVRVVAAAHNIDLSARRRGGSAKADVKKQIRALRAQIGEAIQAKQKTELKKLRRRVKRLKAQTRRFAKVKSSPVPAAAEVSAAAPSA